LINPANSVFWTLWGKKLNLGGKSRMKQGFHLKRASPWKQGRPPFEPGSSSRAGLTPRPALLIEKLSPRLPGESDPGVFEGFWPGNDGGGHPCVSFVIKLAASYKLQITDNQYQAASGGAERRTV
jgi:hypothetical protein